MRLYPQLKKWGTLMAVEIRTIRATEDKLREHYSHITDKPFFPSVVDYMTRKPVIALILEAPNAVNKWRKLMGILAVSNNIEEL